MTDLQRQLPDFSQGDEFLLDLRAILRQRQGRRSVGASLASALIAVWLLVVSTTALQHQVDQDLWETYLQSQDEEAAWLAEEEEAMVEIYLESLYQEEDLDVLMGELLELYGDDNWLRDIKLEG